ncbi:MAG: hypothetical protein HQM09_00030 [Candidatus Riflebacteria bacterium]|nr:hypothetical protein [Candidatus Riflebacteria bacterium]
MGKMENVDRNSVIVRMLTSWRLAAVIVWCMIFAATYYCFFSPDGRSRAFKNWIAKSRAGLLEGKHLAASSIGADFVVSSGLDNAVKVPGTFVIATSVTSLILGIGENELLHIGSFTSADMTSDNSSASCLLIPPRPDVHIVIGSGCDSLPILVPWENADAVPVVATSSPASIAAFLQSAGGNWTASDPIDGSMNLFERLTVICPTPICLPMTASNDIETMMGALARTRRSELDRGVRISAGALRFPAEVGKFPAASGIMFEALKLMPAVSIDWMPSFKKELRARKETAELAGIWERRASSLPTWTPTLSDDVGALMGSKLLRFNRPDILSATITQLNPMDEINILRAFHATGCETSPVFWYPNPCEMASAPPDPFLALTALIGRGCVANADEARRILKEYANSPYDIAIMLATGDIELDGIPGNGYRIIACNSGSIKLNGKVTADHALLVVKGGNISIGHVHGLVPTLVALKNEAGMGGHVSFETSVNLGGPVRADVMELEPGAGEIKWQLDPGSLTSQIPLLLWNN